MKILLLHKQLLFPRNTGGKIRVLNLLRHLPKWHEITCVCNIRPGEEPHLREMEALGVRVEAVPLRESKRGSARFYLDLVKNVASARPFTIDRNCDAGLGRRVKELAEGGGYDLLICDTCVLGPLVEGIGGIPKVLFQHNIEAQILKRHMTMSHGWARSRFMRMQWKRMERYEAGCGHKFEGSIAVSENDRSAFERDYGWKRVRAIDTAVDLEYFAPQPEPAEPKSVVFVGSMDWLPNQDGVNYFVRKVWPLVRKKHADAVFRVVGRNPPASVTRLGQAEGVEVVGSVPDVRPYLAGSAMMVVPLLVGGGTRIKIFEAMAMRRAVVSTTIGAEGLPIGHDRDIAIADTPETLAAEVSSLLSDAGRRERIARAGYELVSRGYGTEAVARQFESYCLEFIGRNAAATTTAAENGATATRLSA